MNLYLNYLLNLLFELDTKAKISPSQGNVDLLYAKSVFEIKIIKGTPSSSSDIYEEALIDDIIRCAICSNSTTKVKSAYFVGITHKGSLKPLPYGYMETPIEYKLNLPVIKGESRDYRFLGKACSTTRKKFEKHTLFKDIKCTCVYRKELNTDLELLVWEIKGDFVKHIQDNIEKAKEIYQRILSNQVVNHPTTTPIYKQGVFNTISHQPQLPTSQYNNPISNVPTYYRFPPNTALYPQNPYNTLNNAPQARQPYYPQQYNEPQSFSGEFIIPNKPETFPPNRQSVINTSPQSQPYKSQIKFGNAVPSPFVLSNSSDNNSKLDYNSYPPTILKKSEILPSGTTSISRQEELYTTSIYQLKLEEPEQEDSEYSQKHTEAPHNQGHIVSKRRKVILPKASEVYNTPQKNPTHLSSNTKPGDKRLRKELKNIARVIEESGCNYHLELVEGDLYHWKGFIVGPEATPYEGGLFHVDIDIPEDYPFKAPKVKFTTPIYHPNLAENCIVGFDYLHETGSWIYGIISISTIMMDICTLLNGTVYLDRPLNPEAAHVYKTNRELFEAIAKEWTKKYAQY